MLFGRSPKMVTPDDALPGRSVAMPVPGAHHVNGAPLTPPWPQGTTTAVFGGFTPNPTYQEVCSGRTGHTEAVLVAFDPDQISYDELLAAFWEAHDPTQGHRQGNDIGTQYRSGVYATDDEQLTAALASRERFQQVLSAAGRGEITTDVEPLGEFFYAEEYHQQYLSKNPGGYCGLGGTGLSCPVGIASVDD
jgi:peptide-methionine (S)-S-oxide reductase